MTDEAVNAALDVWMSRSAAGLIDSAEEHVKALIDAARPIIERPYERQIYDAHQRGWKEGVEVTTTKLVQETTPFDWHAANKEGFLSWAIIVMLSDGVHNKIAEQVLEASDGAKKLIIKLDINGVVIDAVPFFERLWQEMQNQAQARAVDLVEDELTKLNDARAEVEQILTLATLDVRRRFKELGLPMKDDGDEW
jgi:hypothetical protein